MSRGGRHGRSPIGDGAVRKGAVVRFRSGASGALLLALGLLQGCQRAPEVVEGATPAQRLARSLAIVRTSTPAEPKVLRVLFYGQSITSPKWTEPAMAAIAARYPDTRFVVRNMGIGGFGATLLERTTARDIGEFYPDLIVFHVYGDHHAYERIIRLMRSRTAAEIIVQTDHVTEPVEPQCDEGIHLTLTPPPGCKGMIRYRQHSWEQYMSGNVLPDLAQRYGLVVDPRRYAWNAYLRSHGLAPEALIADMPHPNDAGWALMARLFTGFFARLVASWHGEGQSLVATLPPPAGDEARIPFTGNRLEILASGPLDGRVAATIDGKAPAAIDGCWQTSRTTSLPGVPSWPAIRQVTVDPAFHRPERWTATVTALNADQTDWRFALSGLRTGPDGAGTGKADFASPSGRIRIAAKDWVIPDGYAYKQARAPEGLRVTWEHRFVCRDQPSVALLPGRIEQRHLVATDLPDGPHVATLRFAPGARALVRELRAYRPPLVEHGAG